MVADVDNAAAADQVYEWGVRLLYAALIVGNLALLWDAWKDTASGMEMRARWNTRMERVKNCEGCARRREWINRNVGRALWDAQQTVEVGPDWDDPHRGETA